MLVVLLLATCSVGGSAFGQQQTGSITGAVKNSSGLAVPGARVAVIRPGSNAELITAISASDGAYLFLGVPYGTYVVNVAKSGFMPATAGPFILADENHRISFTLILQSVPAATGNTGSSVANGNPSGPPSFRPSGIQGTTAPSGYSSGATAEQSSRTMDLIVGLPSGGSGVPTPPGEALGCEAESSLLAAVRDDHAGYDANHKLGVFLLWHAEPARSIQYLSTASVAEPGNTDNSRDLAYAYLGAGRYEEAAALLQRLLRENATVANLHNALADVYAATGHKSMAIAEYRTAAAFDQGEQNTLGIGFNLLRLESVNEAAQLFTIGTNSHPSSPRLWLARGVAESLQQKSIAAIQSLFHAVSLDPNLQPAYSFLANLCGLSSEADAGITSAISKFVVAHPHNAVAHYDLAMALWGRHDGDSSVIEPRIVSELKLAIANDPRLGSAHFRLGVLYSDARNYQDAALELRKAIELEPEKPDWHYRLFLAYRGGKRFEQADQELKVFEKMRERSNPSNDETVQYFDGLNNPLLVHDVKGEPCDSGKP